MDVKLVVTALLLLALGAPSHAQENSTLPYYSKTKYSLKVAPAIGGLNSANAIGESSQAAVFGLGTNFDYKLSKILDVTTNTRITMVAGQSLSRFGDGAPTNGITLYEALINVRPTDFISIHAGAINQGYLSAPLLVSDNAFPGAMEKIFYKQQGFNLGLTLEQTVPTSSTLSTKTVDRESSPSFMTETLKLETTLIKNLAFGVFGTLFQFNNLPSKVVFDSTTMGNSQPQLAGPNTARFTFDFSGWLAGASTIITVVPELKFIFSGSALENSLAPQAFNHGQILSAGAEIKISNNFIISPTVENFFNESDTSPAYYNSYLYGHNNRQGYSGGLVADFPQSKFKITSKYVDADVINEDSNQARQQVLTIKLETSYDIL